MRLASDLVATVATSWDELLAGERRERRVARGLGFEMRELFGVEELVPRDDARHDLASASPSCRAVSIDSIVATRARTPAAS